MFGGGGVASYTLLMCVYLKVTADETRNCICTLDCARGFAEYLPMMDPVVLTPTPGNVCVTTESHAHRVIRSTSAGLDPRCPLCRASFARKDIVNARQLEQQLEQHVEQSQATAVSEITTDVQTAGSMGGVVGGTVPSACPPASPKIAALLLELETLHARGEKGIVFSQFTSFLDLIGRHLAERQAAGLLGSFTRLDGSMSQKARAAAMDRFRSEADCGVILVSTKAGGQGINLTCANHVFM